MAASVDGHGPRMGVRYASMSLAIGSTLVRGLVTGIGVGAVGYILGVRRRVP